MKTKYILLLFAMLLFVLPACGGGGGDGSGGTFSTPKYLVTYNGNGNTGGNVPVDSGSYANGDSVTVLGNTGSLVKTSYVFGGWNTASNGSGTTYVAGNTFTMGSANVILYALWTAESATAGKWDVSKWDDVNAQWGP